MRYPLQQEYRYTRTLLGLTRAMKRLLVLYCWEDIERWAEEACATDLPTGEIIQDADDYIGWRDALNEALQNVVNDIVGPTDAAIGILDEISAGTLTFSRKEWDKMIRAAYGVAPQAENPARFSKLMETWADDNALLINDIPTKTIRQIRDQAIEALTSGTNVDDTTEAVKEIMRDRTDVSDSRARLIARDQVSKLNANFNEQRQQDIGVNGYTWRTVGDERVRPTHRDVADKQFLWSNPPLVTGGNHPGEDYQCRCWAEPILPEYLAFQASLQSGDNTDDEEDLAA
jgi:SPP1 gp7 family putative phage head morphogenesis protein